MAPINTHKPKAGAVFLLSGFHYGMPGRAMHRVIQAVSLQSHLFMGDSRVQGVSGCIRKRERR